MRVLFAWCLLAGTAPAGAQFIAQLMPRAPRTPLPPIADGVMATPGPARELDRARTQIDHARDSGRLTRREAKPYRREAAGIATLTERLGSDGLSTSEARELETRARILADQAALARQGGSDRR